MKNRKAISAAVILAFMLSTNISRATTPADKEKMKPEELIAKHLESIGPAEARAAATSRVITGTVVVNFRQGGRGQAQGKAVLASQGAKNLMALVFGLVDYPQEKIGYDGQRVTISQIKPGVRTVLGRFLSTSDLAFKEGLAAGTLSSAWPLLDMASRSAKLQYDGLKKVDKRQLHALKYSPQKSSNLKVILFFDPETFQHARTEYHQILDSTVAANRPGDSVAQEETRVDIIEEFSDFKPEGKLMLPHGYKLQLEVKGPSGAVLYDWIVTLTQFEFGQLINEKEFNVESN